jgi:hypothetical protein
MDSHRLQASTQSRTTANILALTRMRLWSVLVVGALIGAALVVGWLEASEAPISVGLAVGVALFLVTTTFIVIGAASPSQPLAERLRESGQRSQLGPDAEQVAGRKTGAKT